ncbi:hypothetical protein Ae168Ps1_1791c [Pseudonocardia sp. Ae168_Ps1]|uniref:hypothetical protein n=1 Tax=unclassified Pseudonocardia TaxID=2619320 RepID=UPI0006CB0A38|nr:MULTISPECIES: hypothetical protein [unclassified Pseudonocardia]ALE72627.1 hypothetical protein FRP1_05030 [Pseudonocardia sp. EC080625-04]ALL75940.1 hypothetical protein AD006_12665 [Pseudonocardia sp. EC080610-09]ALL82968.1 hypothetical protein AD017_20500 [Pseudonocardia sp. EC080619-01]OLL73409.1 hypothetical protein Ae150APs1_1787c [Pseudonocardia sp. Ae150A_Ps1]OLL79385.1 hypothetical protein Ae168Ps1_1791c [Pseudonocardia sp. Ae168_Ps1]
MASTVGTGVGDLWIPLCVPLLVMVLTMGMAWIEARLPERRPRRGADAGAAAPAEGADAPVADPGLLPVEVMTVGTTVALAEDQG